MDQGGYVNVDGYEMSGAFYHGACSLEINRVAFPETVDQIDLILLDKNLRFREAPRWEKITKTFQTDDRGVSINKCPEYAFWNDNRSYTTENENILNLLVKLADDNDSY